MNRLFFFAVPLLVLLVSVAVIATFERGRPAAWRAELNAYLSSTATDPTDIRHVARASKPWNFDPTMRAASHGESVYYRTDDGDGRGVRARAPAGPTTDAAAGDGRKPLPFPPQEVWCVFLDGETAAGGDAGPPTVLFVARHQDLYNADWIAHEAATSTLQNDLEAIGCPAGESISP